MIGNMLFYSLKLINMLQTQLPISFMLVKIMQRVWIFPCIQNKFIHTCRLPVGNKQTILCGGAWGHLSSFGTRVSDSPHMYC